MQDFSETTLFSVHPDIVYTLIDNEAVFINPQEQLLSANVIATEIWQLLETQPRSIQSLREYIVQHFDVDASQCTSDLNLFFSDLLEKKLVTFTS